MSDYPYPTHTIETPMDKHKVVLKDFISGYDDEAIEAIYTRGRHVINTEKDPKTGELKAPDMAIEGSAIQEAEREGVKRVVISVDGKEPTETETIFDLVYRLRKEDTAFIKAEVNKVINPPEDTPAKKNNASKTTPAS